MNTRTRLVGALSVAALIAGSPAACIFAPPSLLSCNTDVNCPAALRCDTAQHACVDAASAEGEGEGAAEGEGEGVAGEGEGEGVAGEGEGEGVAGEGEGEGGAGEGEGEGGLESESATTCAIDVEDRFIGPVLGSEWTRALSTGTATVDGDLEITVPAGDAAEISSAGHSLDDGFADIEIARPPSSGVLTFSVSNAVGDQSAAFRIGAATVEMITGDLGVDASFTLRPTDRFVRLRGLGGVLSWSTSPDGAAFFTRQTVAAPSFLADSVVRVGAVGPVDGAFGDVRIGRGSCAGVCTPLLDDTLAADDADIGSFGGAIASATHAGGNLRFDIVSGPPAFAGAQSGLRDFRNTSTTVLLSAAANGAQLSTFIQLQSNSQNLVDVGIQSGTLHFQVIEGGAGRGFTTQADDRVANAVLRLVVDATGVTLLGSPDGISFTQIGFVPTTPAFADAALLNFGLGSSIDGHGAGQSVFNHVTILPAACP